MQLGTLVLVAGCVMGCSKADVVGGDDEAEAKAGGSNTAGSIAGTGKGGAPNSSAAGGSSGKTTTGGRPASDGGSTPGAGRANDAGEKSTSSGGSTASAAGAPATAGSKFEPGDCGLDSPAFCETFESPHPGGRGGDLDERAWSFSRWAHSFQYFWFRLPASTYQDAIPPLATFCGQTFKDILPPGDVRICDGVGADGKTVSRQLNELFDDQMDFAFNSMRIRQPFDFTNRTGKIVWDVDAKFNPYHLGHGWWFEMWITEDPAPMPYHEAPTVAAFPRAGFGFSFRFSSATCKSEDGTFVNGNAWMNAPENVFVSKDYRILHEYGDVANEDGCFKTMDAKLNHFELRINKSQAELWASDYENPGSLKKRATIENLDLPFERGYVHFQHAAYNAAKDGLEGCEDGQAKTCPTRAQTFRWDNIGFDGPVYATPRAYDVEDSMESGPEGGYYTGWYLKDGEPLEVTAKGVDLANAKRATLNFNLITEIGGEFRYRFNGGEWHSFTALGDKEAVGVRTYSLEAPLEELVDGDNKIGVWVPNPQMEESIGNIDITIEVQ